ncbi:MAG: multidrug effflux MFS transporter [Alphaproteobacteria bacterium]|nr:multidrug effflux MFS transporter [Alphaproteobacteria bacterium]
MKNPMLFLTVLITIILAGAEVDLFIPSFPNLIREFNLSPILVQLTLSMNFLSYCVSSLFVGSMGDRYGRRPIIIGGLIVFIIGSIFCVFAPSFPLLVIGRFLQGIGMAGPAVLGYVVIADITPIEKQAGLMGTFNGVITFAMAFAPVVGSYINIYFGWQGNFVVLLGLGVLSLAMSLVFIPNTTKPNKAVSLSLTGYLPLLTSWPFMRLFLIICLLVSCYWVFIGMGPILYMEDMNVPIQDFGFYQGAIAWVFSIMSIVSPMILNKVSKKMCLHLGLWSLMGLSTILLGISLFIVDTPWIITLGMSLYVMHFVFPINIMYPESLDILPGFKGRAAAMINFGRLAFSAIGIEVVSYLYTGTFLPIAVFIFIFTLIAFVMAKSTSAEIPPPCIR